MAADSKAELMTAYLDDALEAGEVESFEQMLAASPEAKREVEDLRRMLSLVRELPPVEAPPDFYENVAKKLRRRRGPASGQAGLVAMSFQVLSILVIVVIAATILLLEIEREDVEIEKDPTAKQAASEDAVQP